MNLWFHKYNFIEPSIETDFSGTTFTCAVIRGNRCTCANIGDSRTTIAYRTSHTTCCAQELTKDHKPDLPAEKARIEAKGGRVFAVEYDDGVDGPMRVWLGNMDVPGLAMSRSLGDVVAHTAFSKQVGGDYYDVITLDNNNFCVAIADVSGKGVSAALMMANLQAFLKTICKQGMQINEATGLINDLITENTTEGKFITFFWAIIENDSKQMLYVNAGHNHPLLIRKGKIKKLDKGGIILGVMNTMIPYISERLQLETDDVMILFTDGVS